MVNTLTNARDAGDTGSIPGWGRSPGVGNGNPLQYSRLGNPMDRGYSEVAQSCPTLVTPWTLACQAPLSMGFPRREYWSGLPFLSPGHLPDPRIEPRSPALQADSLQSEHGEALQY